MNNHRANCILKVSLLITLLSAGCKEDKIVYVTDDLTNPAVQPKVLFTSPANNSVGPYNNLYNTAEYNAHLIVRFNKLMRKSSFVPGIIKVQGFDRPVTVTLFERYYIWFYKTSGDDFYNDLVEFSIRDSLTNNFMNYQIGQTYTVVIDPVVEDINGNHLSTPYSFTFKPEPYFRVLMTSPKDGSKNNNPYTYISLYFNSEIDQNILSNVHIAPQVTGQWSIADYDSRIATLVPVSAFPYNAAYSVTVDADAADIYNNRLTQQYVSNFSISPFQLSYSYPQNGLDNVPVNSGGFYFQFNGTIDTSSIRPSFSITPPISGTITPNGNGFNFVPSSPLEPSTTYTITISSELKTMDGTPLSPPITISFTTGRFAITSTSPYNGSTSIGSYEYIFVDFNSVIDTGSVRNAFSISPPVDGNFLLSEGFTSFRFIPLPSLGSGTTYTVTISTGMKSRGGTPLLSPFTFSFTTQPFEYRSSSPVPGETNVSRVKIITVEFSEFVDTGTVRNGFKISPEIAGEFNFVSVFPYRFRFNPTPLLQPNTMYTVTLTSDLKSRGGSSLSPPYSFSFTTGPN